MLRILMVLTFALTACGNQNNRIVLALDGMERQMTEHALNELNRQSGKKIAILSDANAYIYISVLSKEEIGENILGKAWVGGSRCRIEISDATFEYGLDWVITVVWHEVGHCHYLDHVEDRNDIMYRSSQPIYFYSKRKKESFFGRLHEIQN